MEKILLIIALLVAGYLLGRYRVFSRDSVHALNQYVIWIALPPLVLLRIHDLEFTRGLLVPILVPWICLAVSAALVLLLARIFTWSRETVGALLLLAPLGNTSFLGIPMVEALLGASHVPYAVLYDQLGSFLALATYGSFILASYAGTANPGTANPGTANPGTVSAGESRFTKRQVLRRIGTFPPFVALVLAVITRAWAYPAALASSLELLGQTLVPVVMIAVGIRLRIRMVRATTQPLAIGLGVKMLLAPLAVLAVCRLLHQDSPPAQTAILEAGMPPMVTAGALALQAELAPDLVAAMIGFGILVSLVTLPAFAWLIHALLPAIRM